MKNTRDVAKKLEDSAKKSLEDSLNVEKLEIYPLEKEMEKQDRRQGACGWYELAATIRGINARRHREDGEEEKAVTEYLKSAESFILSGEVHCEDDRNERATVCFDKAITQYYEAKRDDLIAKVHNEYGQFGTKKQLNLGKLYFPLSYD